jgi:plastocyanin
VNSSASRIVWSVAVAVFLFLVGGAVTELVRAAAPRRNVVTMARIAYFPTVLTVPRGTRVAFDNEDTAPHTVTADDGSVDSGIIDPGRSFVVTVDRAFEFHCEVHPSMTARILVS